MQLMDLIRYKYKTVSVVGMAKNAGKTVTFNRLLEEAAEKNILLGLTSIGRDGEGQDLVTGTEKPTIYVMENTIVATTEDCLLRSEAKLEILEVTDYATAMGRVIICRVKSSGILEIAGPDTNAEIKEVAMKMMYYGAEIVLIDGAINRKTAASPAITEATILATGAVVSRDIHKVVQETLHQVDLFNLSPLEDDMMALLIDSLLEDKAYSIVNNKGEVKRLDIKTAINGGTVIGRALEEDSAYVILSGSLVKKTLEDIMTVTDLYKNVTFVVKDATKIFIGPQDWKFFIKRGFNIKVAEKINTLVATLNPYAPQGYQFNPKDFYQRMKETLPLPVIDVMLEEE
ncbi:lysine 5,6-aminomutase reactivase subunit KamB [Natronincola ferrireducens]|uniref:Uncharacterized protein n=1 Tax=Natronincola ferrireducens TaxID=393762 RepID=A0A1G9FGT1_9FIRM|nr:hypothetical protein [Natronincola ferrireducens]SDK87353.1 hypothetical protein SAMN05660472_02182 [Natronincola ferrireducens]